MANAGFIGNGTAGRTYAPGYFLAAEECKRVTFDTALVSEDWVVKNLDGTTYIKQGTPVFDQPTMTYGLVYEDIDITNGNMPGSLVITGAIDIVKLAEVLGFTFKSIEDVENIPNDVTNVLQKGMYERVIPAPTVRPYVKAVEENH